METNIYKTLFFIVLFQQSHVFVESSVSFTGYLSNKTVHHSSRTNVNDFFKNKILASYRSFQPVSVKYTSRKMSYPRADDRPDYDINSYDSEYGGVVSNFTSSIYDDNPPLYPNPELIARSNQVVGRIEQKATEIEVELPDDSLADADLKEHNIIDSVTYLYGFTSCHGMRAEWKILIFITSGIAVVMLISVVMWLLWSEYAAEFRRNSKLYPININLCCCLIACTLIYIQAIVGLSSPPQCERIALLLHYTHISCALWIVALAATVAEYCVFDTCMPLKYNYLLAYGAPAVVVMFNYALSMEQYEIKHYCWMSIEKGMVMGFMIPAMALIVINTAIIILALQSVNRKQAEMLTAKIQELVDNHMAHYPKNELVDGMDNSKGSVDTLDVYTPGSSRKNTDSSDTLDKQYNMCDDDQNAAEMSQTKMLEENKGLIHMLFMDNLSWKFSWNTEGNELKSYLNLCLVLEPFFAINWVMGVVAIENAAHWSTPTIYLILVVSMYVYLTTTICTNMPIVRNKNDTPAPPCCEEVIIEPKPILVRARTTDSIPLLDPSTQQSAVTPAPADTISTISI